MRKLLFLDFDGVLHPTTVPDEQLFCRVPLLQEALEGHACEIVISSSWRHYYTQQELLSHFPPPMRQRIVGFTGEVHVGKLPRYQEIQNYLMNNGNPSWRALDDSFIEFPKQCPELLLCDPNVGLASRQMTQLIEWLVAHD